MSERIVVATALTREAEAHLKSRFPTGHQLRLKEPRAVDNEDLAWATALCCFYVPAERIVPFRNIRWLHVPAAGIDRFLSLQATRPDLRLTRHGACAAPAVAEHGLALLFALRRGIPLMVEARQQRRWVREQILERPPHLVRGGEVHVLGYGPIARAVIAALAAVGARVTVYRREPQGADPAVVRFAALRDLPREIGSADALFSVLPAVSATRHLINAEVLTAMKPHSVVVNLGRSNVIDHGAILRALENGHLGGAALDVFDHEPLPADSPLWQVRNLIISPHVASLSYDVALKGMEVFLAELSAFLEA